MSIERLIGLHDSASLRQHILLRMQLNERAVNALCFLIASINQFCFVCGA